MILSSAKNVSLLFILNLLVSFPTLASDRVTGAHIKEQAAKYFSEQGLNLNLLVSDKRAFFRCSVPLNFDQRHAKDWSTVLVRCNHENWETFIRSATSSSKIVSAGSAIDNDDLKVAVLTKNISKGQIISEEYLRFEARPEGQIHGAYNHISDILGRKVRSNIAAGTIIKARHLDTVYSVNKNDGVLVVAGNKTITITTSAIALENGQVGDMIPVKNLKSEKIFKVIITGKKKVAPITNM